MQRYKVEKFLSILYNNEKKRQKDITVEFLTVRIYSVKSSGRKFL